MMVLKVNIGTMSSNMANLVEPAVVAAVPTEVGTSGSWVR